VEPIQAKSNVGPSKGPLISFLTTNVPPPAPLYIGPQEQLIIDLYNSVAAQIISLTYRLLLPNGEVHQGLRFLNPPADRSLSQTVLPLAEGWLLSLQMIPTGPVTLRGQCFTRVRLVAGALGVAPSIAQLFSDYLEAAHGASWPTGRSISWLDGRGMIRSITGTNPAAGVEIIETVPAGARWRFIGIHAQLTTAVAVANRTVRWAIDDGASVMLFTTDSLLQPALTTENHEAGAYGTLLASTTILNIAPFPPDVYMLAGWRIRSATINLQPADDWGAPQLMVEEWLES